MGRVVFFALLASIISGSTAYFFMSSIPFTTGFQSCSIGFTVFAILIAVAALIEYGKKRE